jgi:hypothetical protein
MGKDEKAQDTSAQSIGLVAGQSAGDGAKAGTGKRAESADKMLACRYELKYHITESRARAVAQFVKQYVPVDRYCKLQRSGDYPIVSLYLDSDNMHLCKESLDGRQNRFKLRIRGYTDEPDYPVFFEIKRRINTVIMKSRTRVMHGDVPRLLSGLLLPPQSYSVDTKALNQFQLYMTSIQAKPKVLIRYMRQAFEDEGESRVRVTFDRQLCYNVTDKPEVRLGGSGWQRSPVTENGGVILEIKFNDSYPLWLSRLVECFDLLARAMSKYATSISDSCLLRFCAPHLAG